MPSPLTTFCEGGNKRVCRITQPEKTVYRIRDVDDAIATTVAVLRSEIGKMELMRFSQIVTSD